MNIQGRQGELKEVPITLGTSQEEGSCFTAKLSHGP